MEISALSLQALLDAAARHMPFLTKRRPDPKDPKIIRVVAVSDRRALWNNLAVKFPYVTKAARRLLSLHTTSCASERNWSAWGRIFNDKLRNGLDVERAMKIIFIKANYDLGARLGGAGEVLVTQRFSGPNLPQQ